MKRFFPILGWLPTYQRGFFKDDFSAGLTVAVLLIPQAMAYALLAGLPPITGLYAALLPLLIYPIFGTCRQLGVGPVALDSILVAAGLGALAVADSAEYIALAMLLAIMVGLIHVIVGALRLGFIVDFLSGPVITGFTSAAAIIIAFSQLRNLTGIDLPRTQQIDILLSYTLQHLNELHWPTLGIGISAIILLLILKKWLPRLPSALAAVTLGTFTVWLLQLQHYNIQIVGAVPQGFPLFTWPDFDFATIRTLFPMALTIAFVGFMEAFAVAKRVSAKRSYEVDADQELFGLGFSNIAAGLFGGYPIAGSFSRTAVNARAGAKTGVSSFVTAAIVALTLLFLTPLFYYMPKAVLAAIIITAVIGLIDLKEAKRLYRVSRSDFFVMLISFLCTLLFGVQTGVLLSIAASIIIVLQHITRPKIAFLGRVAGTDVLRNVRRIDEAKIIDGLVIIRMDASFYFANITYFKDRLYEVINERKHPVKAVLIDGTSIHKIDSSAETALREIVDELAAENIEVYFSNIRGNVRDALRRFGFYDKLGSDHFFVSKKKAVTYFLEKNR